MMLDDNTCSYMVPLRKKGPQNQKNRKKHCYKKGKKDSPARNIDEGVFLAGALTGKINTNGAVKEKKIILTHV